MNEKDLQQGQIVSFYTKAKSIYGRMKCDNYEVSRFANGELAFMDKQKLNDTGKWRAVEVNDVDFSTLC